MALPNDILWLYTCVCMTRNDFDGFSSLCDLSVSCKIIQIENSSNADGTRGVHKSIINYYFSSGILF